MSAPYELSNKTRITTNVGVIFAGIYAMYQFGGEHMAIKAAVAQQEATQIVKHVELNDRLQRMENKIDKLIERAMK
jgi:hypothetical protein